MMPKDPIMLLSYVNMHLRDDHVTLEELCAAEGVDVEEVTSKLEAVDYHYDRENNRFY